nr:hypothetical protein [Fischerella thermalis]
MEDKQAFSSFGGSTCLCDRQSYPPIFGRSHQTNHPTLVYVSDRPAMSSWGVATICKFIENFLALKSDRIFPKCFISHDGAQSVDCDRLR